MYKMFKHRLQPLPTPFFIPTDQGARKKWTTLWDYFQKSHRLMTTTKSGSGADKQKKWYLHDSLLFLLPYISDRATCSNLSPEQNEEAWCLRSEDWILFQNWNARLKYRWSFSNTWDNLHRWQAPAGIPTQVSLPRDVTSSITVINIKHTTLTIIPCEISINHFAPFTLVLL